MKKVLSFHRFTKAFLGAVLSIGFLLAGVAKAQPNAAVPDKNIDAATRNAALQEIIKLIKDNYFLVDVGNKVAADIERRSKNGEYERITSAKEFADVLTEHLRAVGNDKHLYLRLVSGGGQPFTPERTRAGNYGISKVEVLPNNVGYLKINEFPPPEMVAETLAASMQFVKNTDALIIDLREHRGGAVATVANVVSYFVPEQPIHLLTASSPRTNFKAESWTLKKVSGARYLDRPVYLLISPKTFSGGEEFSYDMQALKRAVLIGETTGGGANTVDRFPIQNMFSLGVATAQVKNTVTGTNWEGVGVKPDIEIPFGQALERAQEIAFKNLQEKAGNAQPTAKAAETTASPSAQKTSSFKLPETPVGKTFAAFLEALNSGDREQMKKFHSKLDPPEDVDGNTDKDFGFFQQSGGLEPVKIASVSDYSINIIAKMKNSDRWVDFTMSIEPEAPHRIAGIRVQPAQKPAN